MSQSNKALHTGNIFEPRQFLLEKMRQMSSRNGHQQQPPMRRFYFMKERASKYQKK